MSSDALNIGKGQEKDRRSTGESTEKVRTNYGGANKPMRKKNKENTAIEIAENTEIERSLSLSKGSPEQS